jgi:predicted MFS family arabinose efflux permease
VGTAERRGWKSRPGTGAGRGGTGRARERDKQGAGAGQAEREWAAEAGHAARPQTVRLFRFLLYGIAFASSGNQYAIVPIIPVYAHRLALSGLQQGALLSATGLATLAFALPAGALADRFGPRRLTLWAGGLMAMALLIQGVAPTFPALLASRLVFGVGFGMIWTAGLAWLAAAAPGGSSLGGSVASSGAGGTLGPALSGLGVQFFGLTIPFLAAAVGCAAITVALGLLRMPEPTTPPSPPVGASLRAALTDSNTISAAAAIVVAGVTTGVVALLVPARLHAAGASSGQIGLVFSVAGGLFVIGSTLIAAVGDRAVRLPVAFAAMLVVALAMSPASLSTAPAALIGMLCAATATRSVLWTVAYPLGAAGAERSGAGLGVVMGLLNGVWAVTALLGPLLAGLAIDHLGSRAIFGLTEAACIAVLAAAVAVTWRPRHAGQSVPGCATRLGAGIPRLRRNGSGVGR